MQADEIHGLLHPCEGGDKQDHLLPIAKAVRKEGKRAVQAVFHFLHKCFPCIGLLTEQGLDAVHAIFLAADILRFQCKRVFLKPFQPPYPGIQLIQRKKIRFLPDPYRLSAVLDQFVQTFHIRLIPHIQLESPQRFVKRGNIPIHPPITGKLPAQAVQDQVHHGEPFVKGGALRPGGTGGNIRRRPSQDARYIVCLPIFPVKAVIPREIPGGILVLQILPYLRF